MEHQEVLSAIGELRTLVSDGQIETVQRLAALETQMTSLIGNGQPGRITKTEERVESLSQILLKFKYTTVGYAAAVSSFVTGAWILIVHFLKG